MTAKRKRDDADRVIPGMRSDAEPQPKADPDFGPGLEYESGDRNTDFSEADRLREKWTEEAKHKPAQPIKKRGRRAA